MDRSRRDELLARYKVRSRVFDEAARRRSGNEPPADPPPAQPDLADTPTKRELQVLALMAAGMTDSEIGAQLSISPLTVKQHVKKLLARLSAANRAHAVALGLRRELIRHERPSRA